jgi:hypothetical protein
MDAVTAAFAAAMADLGDAPSAEALSAVLKERLATVTEGALPPTAKTQWREFARLLKADATKLLQARASSAISSWPRDRVLQAATILNEINTVLQKLENDRLEDEIRDSIRRHYL